MKNLSSYILIFLLLPYKAWGSIPMIGSSHRCEGKEGGGIILPVDDLLPEHYTDKVSMDKAFEKMSQVTPDQMLQSVVDHLLSYHDLCGERVAGVGGWEDGIGTALCERLGVFDATHDKILSEISSPPTSKNSGSDLTFLKTVYKACRPSTNRYWNYSSLVHISYAPTPEESAYINKAMGRE